MCNVATTFPQTLTLSSQFMPNNPVSISMMHIKLPPLTHFTEQALRNARKSQTCLKSMELNNLFLKPVLILNIMHSLHVLQWDSWEPRMSLYQAAIAHPGLLRRLIPSIFLLLG